MRKITEAATALDAAKRSGVDAAVWQAERNLQDAVRWPVALGSGNRWAPP